MRSKIDELADQQAAMAQQQEVPKDARGYAQNKYLPPPKDERKGMVLCLSGGGFRAALFHLGALRRLNELGILTQCDRISSVSGGSILAAHLARRVKDWRSPGEILPNWEEEIAVPFRDFVSRDLRTLSFIRRARVRNWFIESTAVETLARRLEEELTPMKLGELPDRPQFAFRATDMAYGDSWVFEKGRVGDSTAGYARNVSHWPVARAVAASACFPPVFDPMDLGLKPHELTGGSDQDSNSKSSDGKSSNRHRELRDKRIKGLRLTDGGVFDNMAIDPEWDESKVLLVSDGSATFDYEWDKGLPNRLLRYQSIVGEQAHRMRKRWLISNMILKTLFGTYWGIGSVVEHYDESLAAPAGAERQPTDRAYSKRLVYDYISEVRTDFDAFSEAEIAALENHGYQLAEAAIQKHAASLIMEATAQPFAIPHKKWLDEDLVKEHLANSSKIQPLGRGWWPMLKNWLRRRITRR